MKVLVSVITGEYARRADFYDYFNLLIKPPETMHLLCHDRSPAKGRNLIIEAALSNDCTHVLFIDDDMAYRPDALMRLLQHDVDIVSGLYLSRSYPHVPMVFDVADESGACLPIYLMDGKSGIIPIVAAGFGFLLIKLEALKKMEKPYVRLGELDSEQWCDDIGFFNRARKAGIESYCDLDCRVGHMGTMIIWPNYENEKWFSGYDTNGSGVLNSPQIHPEVKYEFKERDEPTTLTKESQNV